MKIILLLIATIAGILNLGGHPSEVELTGPIEITVPNPPSVTPYDYSTGVAPEHTQTAGTTERATPSTVPTPPANDATPAVRCGDWADDALRAGWPEDRLDVLLDIIWDETRCQPDAVSSTNDYGLLQINRKVWRDYVESFGLTMNDLLVPNVNLWIGLQIAEKAVEAGWRWCQPWDMSGRRECSSS